MEKILNFDLKEHLDLFEKYLSTHDLQYFQIDKFLEFRYYAHTMMKWYKMLSKECLGTVL